MHPTDPHGRVLAAALDLGSTTIKAGLLDEEGRLSGLRSVPAPPLSGSGGIREGDPTAYAAAARGLLESLADDVAPDTPLGLTSQRSTFTLWDAADGRPRLPLISWQDSRAAAWCRRNESVEPEVQRLSGLALSAHYAGPKLASLQDDDPQLAAELRDDRWLFGNLDAYLAWRWTPGATHSTDLSMAARTSLVDLGTGTWSPRLLDLFRVPASILPRVVSSGGRASALDVGLTLTASLADQASGALTALQPGADDVLVNLGTGAFVLRPTSAGTRQPGYLTAPLIGSQAGPCRFALEGTVNGAGPAVGRFGESPSGWPGADPCPEGFAVPDLAGLGSPHWLPGIGLELSGPVRNAPDTVRRRVVVEGLLFRVREILEGLQDTDPPRRILLSGGLLREPAIAVGLASLLGREVEVLEQRESTLLGVARLAAGLEPFADPPSRSIEPAPAGAYLREKYGRWTRWLAAMIARHDGG